MRKSTTVLIALVCMTCVAGCGSSSTTATTIVSVLPLPATVNPPTSRTILGGAIQGVAGGLVPINNPVQASTLAGSSAGFSDGSTKTIPSAMFNRPIAVTTDGNNLYVADYLNNAIRQIVIATGVVTTIAGSTVGTAGSVDATGTDAVFRAPNGITISTDGKILFVTDSGNYTIRKIDMNTKPVTVTTLAGTVGVPGSVDAAIGTNARFNVLNGITTDGNNLYVTDSNNTIRMIVLPTTGTVSGPVTTLAGTPGTTGSIDDIQTAARFNQPARITTDGPNLYVADFGNSVIRKIALINGKVTTIAGSVSPGGASGSHADSTDNGLNARFNQPNGITTDGTNLYVTDSYDNRVRKIVLSSQTVASGPVTTLLTNGAANANSTVGITTDGKSLFITDFSVDNLNHRIQMIQ